MSLAVAARLGPYEVLGPLGAGGMGEVYRARDKRLGRDVAIKVLPESVAGDPEALSRFEREAKAVASLSHPHIVALFDFGREGALSYIVTELLEGETLRSRLQAGPLSVRKAVDLAIQIADGLAAAHERGIIHRDLKPENVFITREGHIKILDFGLAKLPNAEVDAKQLTHAPTASQTAAGVLMGTMGYMSPEQVRGKAIDLRSDIFSFGAVLYEMLAGRRAFSGDSLADMASAILKDDPPDLCRVNPTVPIGLERIVRHCLEKDPGERLHSAHDLAFELRTFLELSGSISRVTHPEVTGRKRVARALGLGMLFFVLGIAIGHFFWQGSPSRATFHRLTFRRGTIEAARFAPDGQTIVYSAAWRGGPSEVFSTRPESTESWSLGFPGAGLLAVSRSGDMALQLAERASGRGYGRSGKLAQASLAGGAARDIAEDVEYADWSRDGKLLLVVRSSPRTTRLECPVGKVLYETPGWIGDPRLSPRGDQIAFLDHPSRGAYTGAVVVVDLSGSVKVLASGFIRAQGLAWSPRADEVWFTATRVGSARSLRAVTWSGRERVVLDAMGALTLHDIFTDGRALVAREELRRELRVLVPGETSERDITWMDYPGLFGFSDDGKTVLLNEVGDAGRAKFAVYVAQTDGSAPVHVADGAATSLSRDSRFVLCFSDPLTFNELLIIPIGPGEPRRLPGATAVMNKAVLLPDGRHVLYAGTRTANEAGVFIQDLSGDKPRLVAPGARLLPSDQLAVSPDGRLFAARDQDDRVLFWPVEGGKSSLVPGLEPADQVLRWSRDGKSFYVRTFDLPVRVFRVALNGGQRELVRTIAPADLTGARSLGQSVFITPDAEGYAYNPARRLSDLYLVDGLR
jgi:serine/threonine protein kinase